MNPPFSIVTVENKCNPKSMGIMEEPPPPFGEACDRRPENRKHPNHLDFCGNKQVANSQGKAPHVCAWSLSKKKAGECDQWHESLISRGGRIT